MGRRLPLRGLALALALSLALPAVVWLGYDDAPGAWVTLEIVAPLSVLTVLAGEWIARRRPGGLRRQFALVAGLGALALAAGVALFVWLMFLSSHDAVLTVLLAIYAAALVLWVTHRLGARALDDLDAVCTTLAAVGEGRRDVRVAPRGDDEITRVGQQVDEMIVRLDREERMRRELFAAVSHDLRTPITSLGLLATAIDDAIGDEATRREYAGRMNTHVRQLAALIDDLFDLTRLEARELTWTMERVAVHDLVSDAVEAMRPAAAAEAVDVHADLNGSVACSHGNPEQLSRVLFNLIQNAIHHTPPDGSVTVFVEDREQGVEVEVADTGAGIAAEQRERVFEPFFRGDASRRSPGAGLGLAISRAIVEAHGGSIWLEDATVGTRVRFRLPAQP
ncbi:HAMP domain-containing histidine kinase [Solirubrobacter sp. CPCC 204708]|uniref:histidine kinase n=1 Tax=Solirubrobacter deserti TaxID=2282478 RepID=A0ABT4RD81_9ACTN|nr:HAMP domain-containing sensor histidine kinase [Solirubrobacter deserti]MBE2317723.1 HAMP domain-containing histidine kinase [Solirubrobacter deserti]MDA0136500.1 HAMP domain-containing histidine kinase [Solirubrobacter deserti]